jgi:PAS domain S-box-containing protein
VSPKAAPLFHFDKFRIDLPWLRPGSRSAYVTAIVLVAVATLARLALGRLIFDMPFITFYPAVILAAFLGGTASGLLALILAALSAWFFFVPPGFSARFEELGLPNPIILFALIAGSNVAIVGALQAALVRRRDLAVAERALAARELQRLADALHNAAFGIAIVDARTNAIEFANPAFAALRGTTVEQLKGANILGSYGPAERVRVQALLETADRTGRVTAEAEYVRPDGSVLPVQIDVTSVYDPAREGFYRVGTTQDITERKRAEAMAAELRALDARLRQILDETPIAMVLYTVDDPRYVWVNATTCRMLEYTADELTGRRLDEVLHPADRPTPIIETRGAVPEWDPTDRRFIAKSGRIVQVRTRGVRLGPDAAGQDLVLGLAEDITRQRQVEAALRQAQKMEAIGYLAGGMAHDFNNLLGVIIADLDMIDGRLTDNPDIVGLVKDATDAALRGADLTRNLLAFARRQPLRPTELAVNAVIGDITRLLTRVLREDVTIALDLSPALWPVLADRCMLESCMVNLASNASEAMLRGGRLRIATANRLIDANDAAMQQSCQPGDYVMIEVADTGAGMSPDVLSRVFEPFFTTKATDKHTGLGLSMVFGFISQSDGHIVVDSELGSGTTVRLFLPRAVPAGTAPGMVPEMAPGMVPGMPATLAPALAQEAALGGHGGTVLVVEDNAALRRVAVRQLSNLGYAVLEADSAEAALGLLGNASVRVLFTDVVMPGGMNGFELVQHARRVQPDIKVLLTSGFPEHAADPSDDPAVAAAQLLPKPYRAGDLARAMLETLHR